MNGNDSQEVNSLEIIRTLFEKTGEELNRSWTRNNILVTINAGLLAVFAASADKLSSKITIVFPILGILASLTWVRVITLGKYYSQRWRKDGSNFLDKNENSYLKNIFRTGAGIEEPFQEKHRWLEWVHLPKHISLCLKILAYTITFVWLLILVDNLPGINIVNAISHKIKMKATSSNYLNDITPKIAVFGGTSAKPEDPNYKSAIVIGKLIAERGGMMINGGYGGIHEASAIGANEAGGKSIGITMDLAIDNVNKRIGNPHLTETVVASNYGERFELLMSSDGFIIIAGGGEGTVLELFGFLNFNRKRWKYQKKLAVLKPVGYSKSGWDKEMFEQLTSFGIIHPSNLEKVLFTRSEEEAVDWVLPK